MKNETISTIPVHPREHPTSNFMPTKPGREDFPNYWTAPDSKILEDIRDQLPNVVDSIVQTGNYELWGKTFLGIAMLLPTQAPQLQRTWKILSKHLDKEQVLESGNYKPAVRAFFITGALLAQTKLPVREKIKRLKDTIGGPEYSPLYQRASLRISSINQAAKPKEEDQDLSLSIPLGLEKNFSQFKSLYEEIAAVPVQDKSMVIRNLHLIDAFLSQAKLPLFEIFRDGMDKGKEWVDQVINAGTKKIIASNEEIVADLLFTGKLDGMAPFIRSFVCFCIISADISKGEAIRYFLQHPEIQEIFWKDLSENGWRGTDTRNLFLQDEEILEKILDTIPNEEFSLQKTQRKEFLLKFIGAVAMLKENYPSHPNSHYLSGYVKKVNEVEKNSDLTILLDILNDRIPGSIYLDKENRIRFKTPQNHQSEDSFFAEVALVVKHNSRGILYSPPAGVFEQEEKLVPVSQNGHRKEEALPKEHSLKEHPLDFLTGEMRSIPLWGDVMFLKPQDAAKVLVYLRQMLETKHPLITQDEAFDLLTKYKTASNTNLDNPWVILPDVLPESSAKKALLSLGIIDMEQKNREVSVIVGFNGKKLVFSGRINQDDEVVLTGQDENFPYSTLHLLLTALSVMQRRRASEEELSKEEISLLHARIKDHNKKARKEQLPTLSFDPLRDLRDKKPGTITFIGKKPVILSIRSQNLLIA